MKRSRRGVLWSAIAAVIIVGAGGGLYWNYSKQAQTEQTYSKLLVLADLNKQDAPDFTLTDQNGKPITLSDLKGKVVVLQFMDPVCTDICPIVSQEVITANKQLAAKASDVVYVAVNVNQYHEDPKECLAFSKEHGLSALPNWHFVTGSTEALQKVWKSYGIYVKPNPDGDVEHSSYMYFIDKNGEEQYVANVENKTDIPQMGEGIAYFTNKLL